MQKEVAQFLRVGVGGATFNGIDDLVGFLDDEGLERFERLCPIPWATIFRTQGGNNGL